MSYENEIKPVLRQMIDNNKPHWRPATIRGAHKQLDEHEAKAKAFDAYHSIISKHIEQQYSHNKHDMVKRFVDIHEEYESGEPNAEK